MRAEESQVVPVKYVCYKHSGGSSLHKNSRRVVFFLISYLQSGNLFISEVFTSFNVQLSEAGGLVLNEASPLKTTDEVHKNKG